jgi:hypothetical protein
MDVWSHIVNLKGRTLKTLDRGEAFDIAAVRQNALILALHSTGNERRVSRDEIESAFKEMETRGEIKLVDIVDTQRQIPLTSRQ